MKSIYEEDSHRVLQATSYAQGIWNDENFLKDEALAINKQIKGGGRKIKSIHDELKEAATKPDTNDYDTLIIISASLLRDNESLPPFLANFTADVLEGKQIRPTKRGADKYKNFARDWKIKSIIEGLVQQFGLPCYTNNELSTKVTAVNILSQVSGLTNETITNVIKKKG